MIPLRTKQPNWFGSCDPQLHSRQIGRASRNRLVARIETISLCRRVSESRTGIDEGRLCDGVVLGVEDEGDCVADLSDRFGGSEGESAAADHHLEIGTADQRGKRGDGDRFREHWRRAEEEKLAESGDEREMRLKRPAFCDDSVSTSAFIVRRLMRDSLKKKSEGDGRKGREEGRKYLCFRSSSSNANFR